MFYPVTLYAHLLFSEVVAPNLVKGLQYPMVEEQCRIEINFNQNEVSNFETEKGRSCWLEYLLGLCLKLAEKPLDLVSVLRTALTLPTVLTS